MSTPIHPPATAIALEKTDHTTYHLAPRDWWATQASNAIYLPERFDDEGFIHCTDSVDEVIAVGNRYYQGDARQYLLLAIDCGLVSAPMVYEDPGRIYPHIYGPLEVSAIRRVHPVKRGGDGRFLSVGEM